MPLTVYQGWAPPGMWGPWVKLGNAQLYGGVINWELQFDTESEAPSTFDVEISYAIGNERKIDEIIGPGSHTVGFGLCGCGVQVRMKSHTLGQNVRIIARHP